MDAELEALALNMVRLIRSASTDEIAVIGFKAFLEGIDRGRAEAAIKISLKESIAKRMN